MEEVYTKEYMWFESTIPTLWIAIYFILRLVRFYTTTVRENSSSFNFKFIKMGYKAMLRDKVPKTINLALKWTCAKTAWVNHVYENQVKIYKKNSDRDKAIRIILGLNNHNFDFHKSITWEELFKNSENVVETKTYWLEIESWVNWFTRNYMYIKNTYDISNEVGTNIEDIKSKIKEAYLSTLKENMQEDLVNFLINSFKND